MIRMGIGFILGLCAATAAAQNPELAAALSAMTHMAGVLLAHLVTALGAGGGSQ